MAKFEIVTTLKPKGDQPQAIEALSQNIQSGTKHQTLLGVTGSGKTFTMAHVICQIQKPSLIIAPNKTLAAQLYSEFKALFPNNAVEYFVSYYDYYQPEAYVPRTDTYIEKDSSINETIDKMRHSATRSLLERNDVIIVASVSCIYGLGSPEAYHGMLVDVKKGMSISRNEILEKLVEIQYERNDIDFHRGTFRVRGDVVEIFPAYEESEAIRMEFFGDEVDKIIAFDPLTGKGLKTLDRAPIYPSSHYVTPEWRLKKAMNGIRDELRERIEHFKSHNKLIEAQRIEQRTLYDLEMIEEIGFCKGIENYSRYLTGRMPGEPPPSLLEYFPKDYLLFLDDSHITVSQLGAMYEGDRSRKTTLVEYGFRLPSALDNRPLRFEEYEKLTDQIIYVSATPASYEFTKSGKQVVEQVVRPTGLLDPMIIIKPAQNQVEELLGEIRDVVSKREKVLVTTLTKRMAENLTQYLTEAALRVRYLHSDIETLERVEILRDLRLDRFDILVGINLLREGLDLPEVSLVAILDADKEGFLRSRTSLIQIMGRAARHVDSEVILYADNMTGSMKEAIEEVERRREVQLEFNKKHKITPRSIVKSIRARLVEKEEEDQKSAQFITHLQQKDVLMPDEKEHLIKELRREMQQAAKELDFETAAILRDQIKLLKN